MTLTSTTRHDPTDGCVDFLTEAEARAAGLTGINAAGQVFMRTDNTTLNPKDGDGRTARQSVRVSSKRTFDPKTLGDRNDKSDEGSVMVVLDVSHMPSGCGVWPAFWMNSVDGAWPSQGEIDMIEGVNLNVDNTFTLHTNPGCSQLSTPDSDFSGHWITNKNGTQNATNCYVRFPGQDVNQGCSVSSPPDRAGAHTYGDPFNTAGGGVYVMLWDYQKPPSKPSSHGATPLHHDGQIALWFFDRGSVPGGLLEADGNPQPPTSLPMGRYHTSGHDCPASHFTQQQIIFDITLCGQWGGREFSKDCPAQAKPYTGPGRDTCGTGVPGSVSCAACEAYVAANPGAFTESSWEINSLRVFATTSTGGGGAAAPTPQDTKQPGYIEVGGHFDITGLVVAAVVALLLAAAVVVHRQLMRKRSSDAELSTPINGSEGAEVAWAPTANSSSHSSKSIFDPYL
jgi:hypothetical protein